MRLLYLSLLKIVIILIKVDLIQNNILHLQSINSDTK